MPNFSQIGSRTAEIRLAEKNKEIKKKSQP